MRKPAATAVVRLLACVGVLGLMGGCDLILGIPNLGDPGNVADMTARFKAIIQAELSNPAPLDWGPNDRNIWYHYMGPRGVAFCGRPTGAPRAQPAYHVNFFQGVFGTIDELKLVTPTHPGGDIQPGFCSSPPDAPPDAPVDATDGNSAGKPPPSPPLSPRMARRPA